MHYMDIYMSPSPVKRRDEPPCGPFHGEEKSPLQVMKWTVTRGGLIDLTGTLRRQETRRCVS